MDLQTLKQHTLTLMQLSTMSAKEQTMWTLFIPSMNEIETKKLHASLEKEVQSLMELSLESE